MFFFDGGGGQETMIISCKSWKAVTEKRERELISITLGEGEGGAIDYYYFFFSRGGRGGRETIITSCKEGVQRKGDSSSNIGRVKAREGGGYDSSYFFFQGGGGKAMITFGKGWKAATENREKELIVLPWVKGRGGAVDYYLFFFFFFLEGGGRETIITSCKSWKAITEKRERELISITWGEGGGAIDYDYFFFFPMGGEGDNHYFLQELEGSHRKEREEIN